MTSEPRRFSIRSKFLRGLLASFTAFCLMASLVGIGLFICCAPFTTTVISSVFSNAEGSAFTKDELIRAAEATRDYTVGSHDRGAVLQVMYEINKSAADAGRSGQGAPDLGEDTRLTDSELEANLSGADESYTLSKDALDHLDDVYEVVHTAQTMIVGLFFLGVVGCVLVGMYMGRRVLGKTLITAPLVIFGIFIALALWVLLDFSGFFAFLHSLFFTEGTWTFSYDSLLIRMYPTDFWVSMGVVWFASTSLACALCLILGILIKGRRR